MYCLTMLSVVTMFFDADAANVNRQNVKVDLVEPKFLLPGPSLGNPSARTDLLYGGGGSDATMDYSIPLPPIGTSTKQHHTRQHADD